MEHTREVCKFGDSLFKVSRIASAEPQRLDTIGRVAGKVYDSGITFEEAKYMVHGHTLSKPLPVPIVKNLESGEASLADFPFDTDTFMDLVVYFLKFLRDSAGI